MKKDKPKAIDKVKEWLKKNFKKGEVVNLYYSPTLMVISKVPKDFVFAYKRVKSKKKKS